MKRLCVPFERLPDDGVLSVSIEKILSELPSTRHNSSNPSTLGRVSFAVGSLPIDQRNSLASILAVRSLTLPLEKRLLHAVPLAVLLRGLGKALEPAMGDRDLYASSVEVESIDDFISHDWATSRWLKLLALLVKFNTLAASIATFMVSLFCGCLFAWAELESRPLARAWRINIGNATFWIVLFFWQQIKACFRRPVMVFFDKACIPQRDEELKTKGILGLSTFLDRSNTLTVLWSGKYFKRLWCTYEISTFLRHQQDKKVVMMPVALALLFLVFVLLSQLVAVTNVLVDNEDYDLSLSVQIAIRSGLVIPVYAILIYVGIGQVKQLHDLSQQLESFDVDTAECFCCTCHHVHPTTGEPVPCDRELVQQTLKQWFGGRSNFESLVRERLTDKVKKSLGALLITHFPLHVSIASTVPLLIAFIPQLFEEEQLSLVLAMEFFAFLCKLALVTLLSTWMIMLACRCGAYFSRRLLSSFLLALCTLMMVSCLWPPLVALDRHTKNMAGFLIFPVLLGLLIHHRYRHAQR